jgi:hypothetical protein
MDTAQRHNSRHTLGKYSIQQGETYRKIGAFACCFTVFSRYTIYYIIFFGSWQVCRLSFPQNPRSFFCLLSVKTAKKAEIGKKAAV